MIHILSLFISWSFCSPLHVVVDAGHGGSDRGAVLNKMAESEITLSVALKLKKRLQNDPRFKVSLTRDSDSNVSLEERSDKAHHVNGDVLLSIHVNSSPDPRARGAEFYFQNQLPPDEESMYLASRENEQTTSNNEKARAKTELNTIIDDLKNNHRIWASSKLAKALIDQWDLSKKARSHSIRQAPFHMVSYVNIPSNLVELGFLSQPDEAARLVRADHQENMAQKLYKGLIEYKEIMDK